MVNYFLRLTAVVALLLLADTAGGVAASDRDIHVDLKEVTVKRGKERYSKKNNPAVDFVRRVMAAREQTDPRRNDFYNYTEYERITLALNDYKGDSTGTLGFMAEYVDTSDITGKPILGFSIREKVSEKHYRRDPRTEREVVRARHRSGLDDIINAESMEAFLNEVLREPDLYQNDITLLNARFVSPLGRIATDFYKFYLSDTIAGDSAGDSLIVLTFVPHNTAMAGFTGRLFVEAGDSTMFIRRVTMNIPPKANVNFVESLVITQEFAKAPDGSRWKTLDDLTAELSIIPGTQGLYARRTTALHGHNFNPASDSSVFDDPRPVIEQIGAEERGARFWDVERVGPIGRNEARMESFVERMRQSKLYYWSERVLSACINSYVGTSREGSKFNFGPIFTFVTYNGLEGLRLRVGGTTTPHLSPRWFGSGYAAYGFRDHRWKYGAQLEYSFIDKRQHALEFPVRAVRVSHLYDVAPIGQGDRPVTILTSLSRKTNDKILYNRVSRAEYILELYNNFSIEAGVEHKRIEPSRFLNLETTAGEALTHYNSTGIRLKLRYAPGEKFYQTRIRRIPINLDAPVLTLIHTFAPRGFAGSRFAVNKTEFSVEKRFWFSAFGALFARVEGGHVWSRTPWPQLLIPASNLSFTIQKRSFDLMDDMEFVNDSYAALFLTYRGGGILFNQIPWVKRLKLREIVTFKSLWGHLSDRNNPARNSELLRFPDGVASRPMNGRPYMEIGVGVENILRLFSLRYVWRLSYRDTPDCDLSGLRVGINLEF